MELLLWIMWALCRVGAMGGDYAETQRCYRTMGFLYFATLWFCGINMTTVVFSVLILPGFCWSVWRDVWGLIVEACD